MITRRLLGGYFSILFSDKEIDFVVALHSCDLWKLNGKTKCAKPNMFPEQQRDGRQMLQYY